MDERELADHERRVRDSVAGDLRAAGLDLERVVAAVYISAAGDTRHKLSEYGQATLRRYLVEALESLQRRNYRETRAALVGGARAALRGGAEDLGMDVPLTLPQDMRHALGELTIGMKQDLKDALKLARNGSLEHYGDAQAVVGLLRKAANRADRAAVWMVHRAHNEGRDRAIERAWRQGVEVRKLWRAERDACPACTGFAGALAEVGEPFHPVVSVEDPSARPGSPPYAPPLHPHCRCRLEEWYGPADAELGPLDLPYALRREAQRSILRGDVQGSEPARLRAAGRLVDLAGLLVPRTVVKRAKKALVKGHFSG